MKFSINLNKLDPIKKLRQGINQHAGRNNTGHITVGQRGGGHKQNYRIIDFKRNFNEKAFVLNIEYDPNRTAHIANIFLEEKKENRYIIAPHNLKILNNISNKNSFDSTINIGDTLFLKNIPIGSLIHNIQLNRNQNGKISRAAGTYSQLLQANEKYVRIKLSSGEHRYVALNNKATLGTISNEKHNSIIIGKAGRSRWLNKRPNVRGTAMNPVDHPHGGGAGKSSSGRPSVTPWSRPTKGSPTRESRKKNKLILIYARNERIKK